MARAKHLLTDLQIKALKPKGKEYLASDGDRLSLCIKPDGSKLWVFVFTSPTLAKKRKTSFGMYPDVSLSVARNRADEYRKLISQKIDPIDHFKAIRDQQKLSRQTTFNKVLDEWLKLQEAQLATSTYTRKRNQLKKDFGIPLGNIPIAQIHHSQIATIIKIKAISATETADRYLGYLNNLWQYSCTMGYTESNIISNLHKASLLPKIEVKNYAKITDPFILQELVNFIYSYKGGVTIRNAMKLLLFLPLRVGNLINLKWQNIDFDKQTLTIKRQDMKIKNANLPDFRMFLVDEVIMLLDEMKLYKTCDFVFAIEGKQISNASIGRALERGGFNNEALGRKQRSHSFRGTFLSLTETHSEAHKLSNEVADMVLDHAINNQVRQAYANRADNFAKTKKLLKWWESFILSIKNNPQRWVVE